MNYRTELLQMIWPFQAGRRFVGDGGENVEVAKTGEYDPVTEMFAGAEVVVDGVVFRGNVAFGVPGQAGIQYNNCILQVVAPGDISHILKDDGAFLPQVTLEAGPVTEAAYEVLREGARSWGCAAHIARMENHERVALFTRLLADRIDRKHNDIKAIHAECSQNWNDTLYMMLLRTMGDLSNREAFVELGRRVHYGHILRERNSLEYVEALLLGASGLLDLYEDDAYTRRLKEHFEYLRNKYSIRAMAPRQWKLTGNNPHSHPVIRLAQAAAFLSTREFLFENVIKCRTVPDVQALFCAEASEYWSTHYIPAQATDKRRKSIGPFKANMLGINLVAQMMFAYGDSMHDEGLKDAAIDLLEKIERESNAITDGWRTRGVLMESAADSQAILQLHNEFCTRGRCRHCAVGRRVIREVYPNEQ